MKCYLLRKEGSEVASPVTRSPRLMLTATLREASMNLTPLERLYAERRALQEHIGSLSNDGSGWRYVTDASEARDAAMLATCEELIADLEARANCS